MQLLKKRLKLCSIWQLPVDRKLHIRQHHVSLRILNKWQLPRCLNLRNMWQPHSSLQQRKMWKLRIAFKLRNVTAAQSAQSAQHVAICGRPQLRNMWQLRRGLKLSIWQLTILALPREIRHIFQFSAWGDGWSCGMWNEVPRICWSVSVLSSHSLSAAAQLRATSPG